MAINKKLINFNKEVDYIREQNAGNILPKSIVFVDDTKKIITHNTEFDCKSAEILKIENKGYNASLNVFTNSNTAEMCCVQTQSSDRTPNKHTFYIQCNQTPNKTRVYDATDLVLGNNIQPAKYIKLSNDSYETDWCKYAMENDSLINYNNTIIEFTIDISDHNFDSGVLDTTHNFSIGDIGTSLNTFFKLKAFTLKITFNYKVDEYNRSQTIRIPINSEMYEGGSLHNLSIAFNDNIYTYLFYGCINLYRTGDSSCQLRVILNKL